MTEHVDNTGLNDSHLVELRGPDGELKDASGDPMAAHAPDAKGPADVFLFVREFEDGWHYVIEDRAGTELSTSAPYPDADAALGAAQAWTEGIENVSTVEVHVPWPEATVADTAHPAERAALADKLAALQGDDS